jgi:hypothetical protein
MEITNQLLKLIDMTQWKSNQEIQGCGGLHRLQITRLRKRRMRDMPLEFHPMVPRLSKAGRAGHAQKKNTNATESFHDNQHLNGMTHQ